jgi:hypothetical protein
MNEVAAVAGADHEDNGNNDDSEIEVGDGWRMIANKSDSTVVRVSKSPVASSNSSSWGSFASAAQSQVNLEHCCEIKILTPTRAMLTACPHTSCNRRALLLPATQLRRQMTNAIPQTNILGEMWRMT